MKRIIYLLIAVAAAATLVLEVVAANRPASPVGLAFIAWGVSPYFFLALLNRWMRTRGGIMAVLVIAAIVIVMGLSMMVDALFLSPDAQSGLAFLFAPLWQWFLLLFASVPLYLANRYAPDPVS